MHAFRIRRTTRRAAAVNNDQVCALYLGDVPHDGTYWSSLDVHWRSAPCDQVVYPCFRILFFEDESLGAFTKSAGRSDRTRKRTLLPKQRRAPLSR